MALQLSISNQYGAVCTYWRITRIVDLDFIHETGELVLSGYINETARNAGMDPMDERRFQLTPATFAPFTPGSLSQPVANPVLAAYTAIKGAMLAGSGGPANEFITAVDV